MPAIILGIITFAAYAWGRKWGFGLELQEEHKYDRMESYKSSCNKIIESSDY